MIGNKGSILIIDDNEVNRLLLSINLKEAGHSVETAEGGPQALDLLRIRPFDVILLDLIMPGMDGYQVLECLKGDKTLRHIPVIVISSMDEMESIMRCIEMGAADYLPKPFNPLLLQARINASLATKWLHDQEEISRQRIEEYNRVLEGQVQEQLNQLQESFAKLRKTLDGTVLALSSALERRDPYTAGHQQRVAQLACAIAKEIGLPEDRIEGLRVAGILHDIGKISVPFDILSKPGRIIKEEFNIIKIHSQVGYDILKSIEFPWEVAKFVLQHHESFDGSGYPAGLAGENISLEARILKVADVVEAMASHRPYRASLGISKALEEILEKRGLHFDPTIVDACIIVFQEKGFTFD